MIRSDVVMSRNPYHPPSHPSREYYGRGGGGSGSDERDVRWMSPHPASYASSSTARDARQEQEAAAAAVAASGHLWQDPASSAAGYASHPPPGGRIHRGLENAPAAVAASDAPDRGSCSPFPPHHPLAPEHLTFDDLENDPVATSSMDSGASPDGEDDEDRKMPAARASSTCRGAAKGGDDLDFEHRHRKRHSLSHDPFEGLTARLFPSEDPHDARNLEQAGQDDYSDGDDEDDAEEVAAKPKATFDDVLHLPALSQPTGHFYGPGGQLYDVAASAPDLMHSPHPTHSFAATPTYATSHVAMLHHYHSPPPPFHHHHGHMASPMPRPVPPPQIYRFGHSAPAHFGPRPPPDSGFPEPSPPAYGYGHPQQFMPDYSSDPRGLARTTPTAKARPAKKSQRRKAPRTEPVMAAKARRRGSGSRSSIDSGSGSSSGGGGGGKPRGSSPSKRSAASVGAASSTRSGERTSQVRHSPTDEELREAKTPRAKSALINWYRRLYDLIEYKNEHGDCNVPQKYTPNSALGVWVNKQRMEKKFMDEGKKSSMTPAKLRALEEVGFTWAKRKGQPSWDKRFMELLQYKDEHGDCSVPTKYAANPALGRWVSTQRSQYKLYHAGAKTQMTDHRMRQLSAIGFRWNMTDREYEESRHLLPGSDDDEDGDGEEMEV